MLCTSTYIYVNKYVHVCMLVKPVKNESQNKYLVKFLPLIKILLTGSKTAIAVVVN